MVEERTAIAQEARWNVEALFPSLEAWELACEKAIPSCKPRWPALQALRGTLASPAQTLKALQLTMGIDRELSTLYTYAHLRHDEDLAEDNHKSAHAKMTSLLNDFAEECSWMEPELLSLSPQQLQILLDAPELTEYRFHLEKILRLKEHTLSQEQEQMLAQTGKALQTAHRAFSAINDADFKFESVQDSLGEWHELTHGSYGLYMRDRDRTLRSNSFQTLHGKYAAYENTLCELLQGQVQTHVFHAKVRNYPSSLDAALFPKNIDTSVYRSLITAVNERLEPLHRYVDLRRRVLGLDTLHLYDIHVPLVDEVEMAIPYDRAEALIIDSVAPLGPEYQALLRTGLQQQRWVDRYENKNKRSGAYSSGCYDSMPYILMNYKDQIKDTFTLAHEAGHSMHSLLSHSHQPYQYGHYPIFLAEVASTFNEELLMRLLLDRTSNKAERAYLINQKIEDIRSTLFRQTMFAEFELLIHELVEKEVPLTPKLLRDEYRKLNLKYFGPDIVIDPDIDIEWARIPHFYYNFYVYQYATGISAALALAEKVAAGDEDARNNYLSFLKGGCSCYPIDMLKRAGIDMTTPAPVTAAIGTFDRLVGQLEVELLSNQTV
jgi:oligoendopeptidase F